jgi:hypothetical protein
MTEAMLLKKGRKLKVNVLSFDGATEIRSFFDESESIASLRGTIQGFGGMINHICEQGSDKLTPKQVDCWQEQTELFCKLKKGRHRIGYFRYPGAKVLLVTHFMKRRDVEQAEYDRALRLKRGFDAAMIWRE